MNLAQPRLVGAGIKSTPGNASRQRRQVARRVSDAVTMLLNSFIPSLRDGDVIGYA